MKQTYRIVFFACCLLGLAALPSASAATNLVPRLEINSMGPTEVRLSWPASAGDFALEETERLTPLGDWLPVIPEPTLSGQRHVVSLTDAQHARFFRLRYEPVTLRSPEPAIDFALVGPHGTEVTADQPVYIEVRASFNAVLTATAFRISTSGGTEATLTSRSANPAGEHGLVFLSAILQQPFESGLPVSLGGSGILETLLGSGAWPFDGVLPANDSLLERIKITPAGSGALTISLSDPQAVTSRWARDGVQFEHVSINPWRSSVTLVVQPSTGGPGITAPPANGPAGQSSATRKIRPAGPAPEIEPNADGQGAVDLADLVFVRARLGVDPMLPENASADVNHDGQIDLLDLVQVRNRFSPPAGSEAAPAPRLHEVAPHPATGEAPWIELSYPRWVEPYFYGLELRNAAQEVLLGAWPAAVSTWVPHIVVVFDGEQPLEYLGDPQAPTAVRVHVPMVGSMFNPTNDRCLLYLNGELVDSVTWGEQPELNAALNTTLFPIPTGGSIGRDGYEQERWVRFAQPTPGADNGLPTPLAMFPLPGGGLLPGPNTPFAWLDPRYSPITYDFELYDADDLQTPVVEMTCFEPGYLHSPGLPAGPYRWRVRPMAGEVAGPWSMWQEFTVLDGTSSFQASGLKPEGIGPQAPVPVEMNTLQYFTGSGSKRPPMKDTRMLCLECLADQGSHAWDVPHGTTGPGAISYNALSPVLCPHEMGHAATAVAQWLNGYYGGDMRQDEINFALFEDASRSPEGELGHGQLADLREAVADALGTVGVSSYPMNLQTDADWKGFRKDIDAGKPVAAQLIMKSGLGTGPVLLVGYLESDPYGKPVRHVLFLSPLMIAAPQVLDVQALGNAGCSSTRPSEPPGKSRAKQTDPYLALDTDGDGLCDLDEEARFPTDRLKADSDGDGIPDKTEIWSYKFGLGRVPRTADPDGDGMRAEVDEDSDDDGCGDGAEDLNHDGSLYWRAALGWGFKIKTGKETDPFWVDEFKVTLTAQRSPLRFKECTRLDVKVTDADDVPVEDAEVQFKMEPLIASFGASGGPPVTYVALLTDKDGKGSTDFCAQETEGMVTVTALYKPCPDGKESKAELKIQILPYDWIFAVQEKAVLTGPVITVDYYVQDTSTPGYVSASGSHEVKKNVGFQSVKGHFYHPKTQNPGRYIDQVTVVGVPPGTTPELRIDGLPFQSLVWTRTNQLQAPKTWEVRIADHYAGFPRFLEVVAGGQRRTTPLVWWRTHLHKGYRERERDGAGNPYQVLSFEWVWHTYAFFFGDTRDGYDISGPQNTWPTNSHTSVSFIPRTTVGGYREGTGALGERPTQIRWQDRTGGTFFYYYVFQDEKNWLQYTPPTQWTVTSYDTPPNLVDELRALGPLPEVTFFLSEIRFERDYIGNELKELQQRKLDPPRYEIRMLTEE